MINGNAYYNEFCIVKKELKTNGFPFVDAISALGIPTIGPKSKLFDVVKSPGVLLHFMLEERYDELMQYCGMFAESAKFGLQLGRIDILTLFADIMPHIQSTPDTEICLAITGSVSVNGQGYNRTEFIRLCEDIRTPDGSNCFKLKQSKDASKVSYVVADQPSSTDKYRLGERLGNLITAQELYDKLKEIAGGM